MQQIHFGRTNELRHKQTHGAMVQVHGRAHLRHAAAFLNQIAGVQQHNFVGQGHGLHLIVRDINHAGRIHVFVQFGNFQSRLNAQCSIQI